MSENKPLAVNTIPHLQRTEAASQLIVNGKPFFILPGEVQNSSFSSPEYMRDKWPDLVASNINTVLGCVTWEAIEPEEDKFEFSKLNEIVLDARMHGLRLILLWFGSFKNGMSTYCPAWVKRDSARFPRTLLRGEDGDFRVGDVPSVFNVEAAKADAKAFGMLMSHIREIDEGHWTVLMVQVENEPGLLGDSRDISPAADAAFSQTVPPELLKFLDDDWELLHADLKRNLGITRSGIQAACWKDIFLKSCHADELFMAYHYAKYLDEVAAAGKKAYPLPLFTNAWLPKVGAGGVEFVAGGGEPGIYPSGGATTNVLDIWQRFCPNLDFFSPDIYMTDYSDTCARYLHRNQPLLIPEQRKDEFGLRRTWLAYGSYGALGASPFGVDTSTPELSPLAKHFGLLKSVSHIILDAQHRLGSSVGVCFDHLNDDGSDPSPAVVKQFGDFELRIERCFVFGKPGPGAGMVVHRGGGKFLLIGYGFQVHARSLSPRLVFTGILKVEEKEVMDEATGRLRTLRLFNGDETRNGTRVMMPDEDPDYGNGFISTTIPARTMIAEMEVYSIESPN
ncbi:glycoside hydrolase [Aspergillus steynii IBT 23096]|uniref:Glycoside hydrolase n=1 Tax=Aspergillus steynii IBT 23096 TaxID=1392250 RepID=A0A2I2GSA4_9EURO|nr:glycoside hydrolase [Aspergillus steynii IBT 23096]PLB55758.1 glycoside hydrolase [Aspergillus steynii IBT 23096]